jgi:hypothetical protein
MIFVMLHYSLHMWLWQYNSRCSISDWSILTYCHLDKWNHPTVIISWSSGGMCCWFIWKTVSILVCLKDCQYPGLKDSQYPGILKNLTNRTLSRSWYVGMMTVQFFSCLPLANVRGMQKNSCCLFHNSVHHLYHPLCVILPTTEIIKFPVRFALWDICTRDSVAFTVCEIFHKIQSSMSCSALHSVFLIESLSVSKCSLCFDI